MAAGTQPVLRGGESRWSEIWLDFQREVGSHYTLRSDSGRGTVGIRFGHRFLRQSFRNEEQYRGKRYCRLLRVRRLHAGRYSVLVYMTEIKRQMLLDLNTANHGYTSHRQNSG
jgi:hypothetical protein